MMTFYSATQFSARRYVRNMLSWERSCTTELTDTTKYHNPIGVQDRKASSALYAVNTVSRFEIPKHTSEKEPVQSLPTEQPHAEKLMHVHTVEKKCTMGKLTDSC